MVHADQINVVYTALQKVDGNFKSRKSLTENANQFLERPLSYNEWRHLWQRNETVNGFMLQKLAPTYNYHGTSPANKTQDIATPFEAEDQYAPTIIGVTASDQIPNEFETYEKMRQYFDDVKQIEERKLNQTIYFNKGPICLVHTADNHFGGAIDYDRVFDELDIILDTPGMYMNHVGDLTNNFISHWTRKINHDRRFTQEEEYQITRMYMRQSSKRLIALCAGNHDNWAKHEAGIDVLKYMLNDMECPALYDMYEIYFTVDVMGYQVNIRSRHQWQGRSVYNDTHGIERAAKFDQALPFDIGVGAHTHASGLYREFNNGGKTSAAVLCGTYKIYDAYAKEGGFPKANKSTAVCTIIDPDSPTGFYGVSDVLTASKIMRSLHR